MEIDKLELSYLICLYNLNGYINMNYYYQFLNNRRQR